MDNVKYIHRKEIHNFKAPNVIVPYLISQYSPKSVLDVGTGLGTWLNIFKANGVAEVKGLDGPWVDHGMLEIESSEFLTVDLNGRFFPNKKYDLALCLEVAEHLEEKYAETFIAELAKCSDLIVFSAAIPGQQGQNHINEQPPAYWHGLFRQHGFSLYEDFRDLFWDNTEIEWWYRQNILVYNKMNSASKVPIMSPTFKIHYELWNEELNRKQQYLIRLKNINEGRVTWKYILKIIFRKLIGFKPKK